LSSDLQSFFDNSNQQTQTPTFPAGPAEFIDPQLLDLRLNPLPEFFTSSQAVPQTNYDPPDVSAELYDAFPFPSSPLPEYYQELSHSSLDASLNTDVGAELGQGSSATHSSFQQSNVLLFRCSNCPDTFRTQGDLNRHNLSHSKPHKCTVPLCPKASEGFRYSKDRDRHVRAKHPHHVPPDEQVKYYCPVAECKFSVHHNVGWIRKDNYVRHMKSYANKQHPLPKSNGEK
jgi:uncharacterized C2H2 Zn-finger protein